MVGMNVAAIDSFLCTVNSCVHNSGFMQLISCTRLIIFRDCISFIFYSECTSRTVYFHYQYQNCVYFHGQQLNLRGYFSQEINSALLFLLINMNLHICGRLVYGRTGSPCQSYCGSWPVHLLLMCSFCGCYCNLRLSTLPLITTGAVLLRKSY